MLITRLTIWDEIPINALKLASYNVSLPMYLHNVSIEIKRVPINQFPNYPLISATVKIIV